MDVTRITLAGLAGFLLAGCQPSATDVLSEAKADFASKNYRSSKTDFHNVIDRLDHSKSPSDVRRVAEARMHLGYLEAKEGNWQDARAEFQAAAAQGPTTTDANFGSLSDQGAYQAAVALVGGGKPKEAIEEFLRFMRERPDSPLLKACRDRIDRHGTEAQLTEANGLLDAAIARQTKKAQLDSASCGPKALRRLLELAREPVPDLEAAKKLTGMDATGASMDGMRQALQKLGHESFAYRLAPKDFLTMPTPAIWLRTDHYVVVERILGQKFEVYDPLTQKTQEATLPTNEESFIVLTLKRHPLN